MAHDNIIQQIKISKKLFKIIDAYYNERIKLNAIICNNKYNNQNIQTEFSGIHEKLKYLETISRHKSSNKTLILTKDNDELTEGKTISQQDKVKYANPQTCDSARSNIPQNQGKRNLTEQETAMFGQLPTRDKDDPLSRNEYRGIVSSIEGKSLSTNRA